MNDRLSNPGAHAELEFARRAVLEARDTVRIKERRFNTACQMMAGILANEKLTDNFASNMEDALVRLAYRFADKMIEKEYKQ
jgi:hypothetical protein